MRTPVSTFDARYSDPAASATGWERARQVLENQGLDVVVEGDAVQVTDDAVLAKVTQAFTDKWSGRWKWKAEGGAFRDAEDGSGEAMVFSVTPAKVFAHDKGDPFGVTRHKFPAS